MTEALVEATLAADKGEVPIGAIAVYKDKIIARGHNVRELTQNPLGHAELFVIAKASEIIKSWRLEEVTIYVTCEPCIMCAGAILQTRIPTVVYGCKDMKAGAFGSVYDISSNPRLNHKIEVISGVMEKECSNILTNFFNKIRNG